MVVLPAAVPTYISHTTIGIHVVFICRSKDHLLVELDFIPSGSGRKAYYFPREEERIFSLGEKSVSYVTLTALRSHFPFPVLTIRLVFIYYVVNARVLIDVRTSNCRKQVSISVIDDDSEEEILRSSSS